MGLLSRFGRAVRTFVARITDRPPPTFEPPPHGGGGVRDNDDGDDGGSRLPDGWSVVGLYHEGEKTQKIHATGDTEVTDSDIHEADAIIVWYEDAGDDGYRWVHGATGWDSLADQVDRVIVIVSPAGE